MTSSFANQLAAAQANLDRLKALAASAPDLFEHANLVCVNAEKVDVYVHAGVGDAAAAVDWRALALKYRQANWRCEQSAAYPSSRHDWNGTLGIVHICIIGAEARPEPKPLFAEEGTVAA